MPSYKDVLIDQHGKEFYIRGGYGCHSDLKTCHETIDWYLKEGYVACDKRLMTKSWYKQFYESRLKRSTK